MTEAIILGEFVSSTIILGGALVFLALYLLPARVLQKRHGYKAWILVFGLIPYVGPLALIWAFAVSTPSREVEEIT
ncbi:MAG: hypothetical protein AAF919_01495 [Pseudomonadota bacterium]